MNTSPEQYPPSATTAAATGLLADLKRLPLIVHLVLLFMIVIFLWNRPILGFNMSGLAWVVPFAVALLVLSTKLSRVTFPYILWLPWALLLFTYLAMVDAPLLDPRVIPQQRTLQLLSPLAVGMAASTWRPTADDLQAFFNTFRRLAYILTGIILFNLSGFFVAGFGDYSGMASEMTTITLFCSFFVTRYVILTEKRDIWLWALLVAMPIINVTRTAIVCSLLIFPFTFAPLPLIRRIMALGLIVFAGIAIFNTERVQKKMFFSGKGTIQSISSSNEDFATSGRTIMWEKLGAAADDELWSGHGTGMGETFTYNITGKTGYPHNDWLLTRYDYGLLGVVTFSACCLLMVGHALLQLRQHPDDSSRILLLAGATGFIPFVLLMFTDNIMVYASYFGNLHYIILGLAYGALRARAEKKKIHPGQPNRFLYHP